MKNVKKKESRIRNLDNNVYTYNSRFGNYDNRDIVGCHSVMFSLDFLRSPLTYCANEISIFPD